MKYVILLIFVVMANAQFVGWPHHKTNKIWQKEITETTVTYLLDDYPGAAAAYSLRLLDADYANSSCVRVRRSSDNAEQDIGFSGASLDTVSLKAFIGANHGYIVTWYDQSGNGNNATAPADANEPPIIATGNMFYLGGKIAVNFNGTSGYLISADNIDITGSSDRTIIFTGDKDISSSSDVICAWGENATGKIVNFTSEWSLRYSGTVKDYTTTGGNNTHCVIFVDGSAVNLDGYALYHNGSLGTPGTTTNGTYTINTTNSKLYFGTNIASLTNYYDGQIQELIIYPSDQSANRTAIEGNINSYYGIY